MEQRGVVPGWYMPLLHLGDTLVHEAEGHLLLSGTTLYITATPRTPSMSAPATSLLGDGLPGSVLAVCPGWSFLCLSGSSFPVTVPQSDSLFLPRCSSSTDQKIGCGGGTWPSSSLRRSPDVHLMIHPTVIRCCTFCSEIHPGFKINSQMFGRCTSLRLVPVLCRCSCSPLPGLLFPFCSSAHLRIPGITPGPQEQYCIPGSPPVCFPEM